MSNEYEQCVALWRDYAANALIAAFTATGLTQTPARGIPASCPRNVSGPAPKPAASVTFEMNQGQFPAAVGFVSRWEGLNLAVTDSGRSM